MRKWIGLFKVAEECGELIQELMKLSNYPNGKHPRRKRTLMVSTQEEAADVLAAIDYFIEKNKLDRAIVEKRRLSKFKKWVKRHGPTPAMIKAQKKKTKKATKRATKKRAAGQIPGVDASSHVETTKTT